jgi:hypothetical protein
MMDCMNMMGGMGWGMALVGILVPYSSHSDDRCAGKISILQMKRSDCWNVCSKGIVTLAARPARLSRLYRCWKPCLGNAPAPALHDLEHRYRPRTGLCRLPLHTRRSVDRAQRADSGALDCR